MGRCLAEIPTALRLPSPPPPRHATPAHTHTNMHTPTQTHTHMHTHTHARTQLDLSTHCSDTPIPEFKLQRCFELPCLKDTSAAFTATPCGCHHLYIMFTSFVDLFRWL